MSTCDIRLESRVPKELGLAGPLEIQALLAEDVCRIAYVVSQLVDARWIAAEPDREAALLMRRARDETAGTDAINAAEILGLSGKAGIFSAADQKGRANRRNQPCNYRSSNALQAITPFPRKSHNLPFSTVRGCLPQSFHSPQSPSLTRFTLSYPSCSTLNRFGNERANTHANSNRAVSLGNLCSLS